MHTPTTSHTTAPAPAGHPATEHSGRCRAAEAGAFVAVWVAVGYLLPLSSNGYLLLGIPLTIAFQVLMRRRPLRELFATDAARFTLDRRGVVMAAALAAVPGFHAVRALAEGDDCATIGWNLAATVGAVLAAFALRAGSVRSALRAAVLSVAVGTGGMTLVYGLLHMISGKPFLAAPTLITTLLTYVALYVPATFLLEEVTFRGALDAHTHHHGDPRRWLSAVYVSTLWGIWHLPVSHALPFPLQLAELVVVHIALGVPLSIAWRRTGNLAGPAIAHAVNDAVRNAVMLGL